MKVLLATAPAWSYRVYEPMRHRYDVVAACTLEEATAHLSAVDVAVVGFHFDSGRPDRLLRILQERGIPAFCVRGIAGDLTDDALRRTIEAYQKELSVREFVDFTSLGDDAALASLFQNLDLLKASE